MSCRLPVGCRVHELPNGNSLERGVQGLRAASRLKAQLDGSKKISLGWAFPTVRSTVTTVTKHKTTSQHGVLGQQNYLTVATMIMVIKLNLRPIDHSKPNSLLTSSNPSAL